MEDAILIAWYVTGDVDIYSDVEHNTETNLDLEGHVAEAAADAEAVGSATYTFAATETLSTECGSSSSAYSISQTD